MGLTTHLRMAINISGANLRDGLLASMLRRDTPQRGFRCRCSEWSA
jgi:hypothetical protein